jgi:DUF1680 family protein
MKKIGFESINITGGFWLDKQNMVRNITTENVYNRFYETHRFEALKCRWKEGMANKPHFFWDSDVAKWIEGVAYAIEKDSNYYLREKARLAIDDILSSQEEDGYYNCYFQVTDRDKRFKLRSHHELYCLGHLIEAAIAWKNATGEEDFLDAMCRYADYVHRIFMVEDSAEFVTPGHPELELALIKLYKATGNRKYFEMAEFFIDKHGNNAKDQGYQNDFCNEYYNQDEMPIKDRSTAEGHSVRAMYLMSAVADLAQLREDKELKDACRRVFDNVENKRMYITGGIGSSRNGEAFTVDYDLPSRTAYAETCASISLAMFATRMQAGEINSKYADVVERALYNGIMSGISLDGKSFFYENPLSIDLRFNNPDTSVVNKSVFPITQRVEVFDCSCCPPNIIRYINSVADTLYTYNEDTLFVHQYMDSEAECDGMSIRQSTDYPVNNKVVIEVQGCKNTALRIPGWCNNFTLNKPYRLINGYAVVSSEGVTEIEFSMPVKFVRANNAVHDCAGRVAVMRGPIVYCAEGVDNGDDIADLLIDISGSYTTGDSEFGMPVIRTTGYMPTQNDELYCDADCDYTEIPVTLIPYYAFANRGETDMQVWLLRK